MIVCKFGGTSVADAAAQRRVAGIVSGRAADGVLVVVSALAGVSDALIGAIEEAAAGRGDGGAGVLEEAAARHAAVLKELSPPPRVAREVEAELRALLAGLRSLRDGVSLLGDASPWVRARFVGFGELLASRLVTAALEAAGIPATWLDAREVVVTAGEEPERDRPSPSGIAAAVEARWRERLGPGRVAVTQGFIAAAPDGRPTLLGRGGSDYSASLLGAALGARRIEIWTDVDGVLTANPRVVAEARRVRVLSFDEASELAYFGARVLHPATILPAVEREIPVVVLNARRPGGEGTTILGRGLQPAGDRWVVKSIADKRGITLVHVTSTRMLMAHGFLARIFEVFERERTAVDMLATSEVSVSLTVDDASRLPAVREALSRFARVEVENGLAVVCLVGEGMRGTTGVAAEVFRAIRFAKPRLITQGASAINLGLVVSEQEADRVVRALHDVFFRGSLPAGVFGETFRELEAAHAPSGGAEPPGPGTGLPLAELARRHGTPMYVYDLDAVAARAARLRAALPDGRFRAFYACKANAHPAVVRAMRAAGIGIEAASPGEAARALECGHEPAGILLSATNARPSDLARALRSGVRVALGARSDVRRVGPLAPGAEVLLRVNPGVGDGHHAHVITGGAHSKFGIPLEELDAALGEAEAAGLRVVGLHAHVGSGILDPGALMASAETLLDAAARVESLRVLDLGGGFGIPYRDDEEEFDLEAWGDGIGAVLARAERRGVRPAEIWVEPGRWLVGPCGWLVAEVTCRKEAGGLVFVGVDSGMNHLLRPALYDAYHRVANLSAPGAPEEWVEVVGNVCETTDVLASNRLLPRPEEGHLLAFRDAGAYGFAMASAYNLWPLPAEVAVAGGREVD
jgi:diaminopimelate decarboxylase/aspartate kinase